MLDEAAEQWHSEISAAWALQPQLHNPGRAGEECNSIAKYRIELKYRQTRTPERLRVQLSGICRWQLTTPISRARSRISVALSKMSM